jgi:hypothetical protein
MAKPTAPPAATEDHLPDPVFMQRCRMDPRWAATQIHNLGWMLTLLVKQIDMPDNDNRTMKTFRGGTLVEQARKVLADLSPKT